MTAEGGPAATVARWGAVAVTTVGCVVAACLYAVAAASGQPEAAYWWQPEPVSGLIPVPGVSSNGLYVAGSPTGPQAESAIRFSVADPTGYVRIALHVSMQERVGKPAVVAYPATSNWQTGGPQPWSARPSYRAGAKPTKGIFSNHGELMTLTFPARSAATGMVLLPDPNASGSFTISFAPPHSADVSVHATATRTPSASSSASASHRPTLGKSHHSESPSSRPTHPHKTGKPSKTPRSSATPSTSASPSASGSAAPAARSSADSGHGALIGGLIAAVVLAGAAIAARRRRH